MYYSNELSLNLKRLEVITTEPVETGALESNGVLYSKNNFKIVGYINKEDMSWLAD